MLLPERVKSEGYKSKMYWSSEERQRDTYTQTYTLLVCDYRKFHEERFAF